MVLHVNKHARLSFKISQFINWSGDSCKEVENVNKKTRQTNNRRSTKNLFHLLSQVKLNKYKYCFFVRILNKNTHISRWEHLLYPTQSHLKTFKSQNERGIISRDRTTPTFMLINQFLFAT